MKEASPTSRIAALLAVLETEDRAFAVGWATVDLDRAVAELAAFGLTPARFIAGPDSEILGARCRIADGLAGGRSLAILEPASEGRLAGTLARRDEGPWVVWTAAAPDAERPASDARAGPFGQERLIRGGPRWGPFRFIVDRAAGTIRS